jgi:predicted PurR-regulated permease PerM
MIEPRLAPTTARLSPTRSRAWRRPIFFAVSALVVATAVVAAHEVMLPFVLALLIAYVLTPLVACAERRHVHRGAAILLVYGLVLGSAGVFVRLAAPRMGTELIGLRRDVPRIANEIRDVWVPGLMGRLRGLGILPPTSATAAIIDEPPAIIVRPQGDGSYALDVGTGVEIVPSHAGYLIREAKEPKEGPLDLNRAFGDAFGKTVAYIQHNALELARIGRDLLAALSRAIFVFFITLMLAAYLMITREKVIGFLRSLVRPSDRADFTRLLVRVNDGLSGVVRGQLVICLINGVLSAIGFAIVGLKYWPVLALVSTVMSLIPIFGSIASAVPAVALGLTQSIGTALFVLVWIVAIHQLEANVLNPKIMGDSAKIHPVLVIFSLLVGEHFFHAVGALLAVPTMSILQSLFLHFLDIVDRDDPALVSEPVDELEAPRGEASFANPRGSE